MVIVRLFQAAAVGVLIHLHTYGLAGALGIFTVVMAVEEVLTKVEKEK